MRRGDSRVRTGASLRSVCGDVTIRGQAKQIAAKYEELAIEAHRNRDNVMAHNYLQHSEHYKRVQENVQ